ncbi:Hypothetical predicted protein [Podarcis lilfordi]|uniref:Uncharacterized protein n=1 Tax=Podarcis lilfordi TaxID=74358 RepID=A0AA35JW93_9SAUR|nr:Hypothetical predicted protein [Podarcis lilfordi]
MGSGPRYFPFACWGGADGALLLFAKGSFFFCCCCSCYWCNLGQARVGLSLPENDFSRRPGAIPIFQESGPPSSPEDDGSALRHLTKTGDDSWLPNHPSGFCALFDSAAVHMARWKTP